MDTTLSDVADGTMDTDDVLNLDEVSIRAPPGDQGLQGLMTRTYTSKEWAERYDEVRDKHEKFMELATMGDLQDVYRARAIWASFSLESLMGPAVNIMESIPSSLGAVLHFTGLLIHETVHLTFSSRENTQFSVTFGSEETAAQSLLRLFEAKVIDASDIAFPCDVLSWCLELSGELCKKNSGRPCATSVNGPDGLLQLLRSCAAVDMMVALLEKTLSSLMDSDSNVALDIVFDASRHGQNLFWIWVYLCPLYAKPMSDYLLHRGTMHFQNFLDDVQKKDSHVTTAQIDDWNAKMNAWAQLFNVLACHRGIEVRNEVHQSLQDCFEQDASEKSRNFAFLMKLTSCSPKILHFLVKNNQHMATPVNLYRGMRQLLHIDERVLLVNWSSYMEMIRQMLSALDPQSLGVIFTVSMRVAFSKDIYSAFESSEGSVCKSVREGAYSVVNEVSEMIVRAVHGQEHLALSDHPALASFSQGSDLQFVVDSAATFPAWTPAVVRYLHAVAICGGEAKAAEIVGRFLIASEVIWLPVLAAFLQSVVPYMPQVMTRAYKDLPAVRTLMSDEKMICRGDVKDHQLLLNVRVLLEWEATADESSPFRFLGIFAGQYLGDLFTYLLHSAIDMASEAVQKGKFEQAADVALAMVRIIRTTSQRNAPKWRVGRYVAMTVRVAYKMHIQLATLLRITLATVSKSRGSSMYSFEMVRSTIAEYLLETRPDSRYLTTVFFHSLLIDCLEHNGELFGETVSLEAWKDNTQNENDDDNDSYSFLEALDRMALDHRLVDLAHSGVIGKGARHLHKAKEATEDDLLRGHVFVDAIRYFCVDGNLETRLGNTKCLAEVLVSVLCQDALVGDLSFGEWEYERDVIARSLEVCRRLEASWVARSLLHLVAEEGVRPVGFYCLPVLRCILASIVVQLEAAVDKTGRTGQALIDKLDDWLLLARQSDILPERFECVIDMVPEVSHYESFQLLLQIWKYFQRLAVTSDMLDAHFESAKQGEVVDLHIDCDPDLNMYRLVVHKHISRLGYLMPIIFSQDVALGQQ